MPRAAPEPEPPVAVLARAAMTQGLDALAAGDMASARRWLQRARRLVPRDANVALTLAGTCLADDPAQAATLFHEVAAEHDVAQAWVGLAGALLRLGRPDDAAAPLTRALSRHAFRPEFAIPARAIGCRPGSPGWCALRSDGQLEIHTAASEPARLSLDGKAVRGAVLPAKWPRCHTIEVRAGNTPLLGSPIEIAAIRRLAGCVEVADDGISGWAWHPADPDRDPVLTLVSPSGARSPEVDPTSGVKRPFKQCLLQPDGSNLKLSGSSRQARSFVAAGQSITVPGMGPLARPRSFRLSRAELAYGPGLYHLRGPDGSDLPGSPLDPFADQAARVATAARLGRVYPAGSSPRTRPPAESSPMLHARASLPAEPVGADGRERGVTIAIPIHNGGKVALACLDSVLAALPDSARVLVVDDGSSETDLVAALDALVRQRRIDLLRHPRAMGFPAAANAGIRAAVGHDVVLLNSDTLVPPGWLPRLRKAAYARRDIGTVTPLSNDASILSYPGPAGTNPRPDQTATDRLDRAAQRANGDGIIDIPVGVGFCLYLRRDCLDTVGSFRADLFAQGYGEENDLCLRARQLGWRSVALTGLFVGHLGGTSFGGNAGHLRARNSRIVERLHPGYDALISDYCAREPLAEARRRIDLVRWRERARLRQRSVILITHNDGGGVEQQLIRAMAAHAQATRRPIVLRPAETAAGEPAIAVQDGGSGDLPNLVYAMPRESGGLLRLLRAAKPEMIELHHCASHPPAIYDLVAQLSIPYDVCIHDYAWFCPRISLVGAHHRYCGEPELSECEACITDNGHFLQENISVAALRHRSAAFLSAARRVVVPSEDTGIRMRRHFSGLATETVPHEDDNAIPRITTPHGAARGRASVCVVGGLGVHKGYDIVLSCARDAVQRALDIEFVVVGHTIDDARLLATERVFVTGRFEPGEAVGLIAAQNARLGFVASICPETWCLSLGDIWRAGLQAVAFDIGAPAERIRGTGRGILLPLNLSASAINNRLIAMMGTA